MFIRRLFASCGRLRHVYATLAAMPTRLRISRQAHTAAGGAGHGATTEPNERAIATGELVPMAADVPGYGEQPFSLSVNANNEVSAQHSDNIGLLSRVVIELDAAVQPWPAGTKPWAAASGAGGGNSSAPASAFEPSAPYSSYHHAAARWAFCPHHR